MVGNRHLTTVGRMNRSLYQCGVSRTIERSMHILPACYGHSTQKVGWHDVPESRNPERELSFAQVSLKPDKP